MTDAVQTKRYMERRPARVTIAVVVLAAVAALAFIYVALSIRGYVDSATYDGIASRMTFLEFVADAPDQVLIPTGLGTTATAAAFGVIRRRSWGRILAILIGLALVLGGLVVLVAAVREWGLPGSFSGLLLAPAIVAILVGAFVGLAAFMAATYFREAPRP
jgi:hypothetical protein